MPCLANQMSPQSRMSIVHIGTSVNVCKLAPRYHTEQ